jgi:16S rRNA (adenine1518-N6/adenine1519-N6)-dimethyltransferase
LPLFRPSELKSLLNTLGTGPKKRLSQNFLIDGNIIQKIADLANIQADDTVLEIGAGPGALTEELLKRGATVYACEIDPHFIEGLRRFPQEKLHIIPKNILEVDLSAFTSAKVVANLPYHLTSPILEKLMPLHEHFRTLTLMVQKEVRERMMAKGGEKERSSLSVFIEFWGEVTGWFDIKPTCFWPRPKVTSSSIHIELRPPILKKEEERKPFFELTRGLFSHRRKMIRASLKRLYPSIDLQNCPLETTRRPEELSLQEFLKLHAFLRQI